MRRSLWLLMIAGVTVIAASLSYRLHKGKPIFLPRFVEVRFKETWCSGQSDRRLPSGLAQAPGILWVVIAKDRLHVGPHFPFNLAFAAEALGWDHNVAGEAILDVRMVRSATADEAVQIRYRHLTGDEETLQLAVQDRQALVAALAKIRGK